MSPLEMGERRTNTITINIYVLMSFDMQCVGIEILQQEWLRWRDMDIGGIIRWLFIVVCGICLWFFSLHLLIWFSLQHRELNSPLILPQCFSPPLPNLSMIFICRGKEEPLEQEALTRGKTSANYV